MMKKFFNRIIIKNNSSFSFHLMSFTNARFNVPLSGVVTSHFIAYTCETIKNNIELTGERANYHWFNDNISPV